ncbi:MAG: (2Fe-2S)-binding protein [Anaerolineaceae bacterium]|nr:(2Fe-2S)-binding protein [Anaerolineaceae bacterium]
MTNLQIQLNVNQHTYILTTNPTRTLLEVLRQDIGLMGVKDACGGEGECGACTVLLDGAPVNSCLVLVGQAEGCEIETIEGLAKNGQPHPIQNAFVEAGAVQCGYCTPGAVMATKALLARSPDPDDEEIRQALSGNLCRCTGYSKMLTAVHQAAGAMRSGAGGKRLQESVKGASHGR